MRHRTVATSVTRRRATLAAAALSLVLGACASIGDEDADADTDTDGAETTDGTEDDGASAAGDFEVADWITEELEAGETPRIALSYHDPSLPFATPLRAGIEQAVSEFDVEVDFIGPAGGSAQDQVSELETLISQQRYHAFAVSSASNDALRPVIDQAIDAGIPVISFNTSNPESEQLAFVGQDLEQSGRDLASSLLDILGDTTGEVVVFSVDAGAGWSNERFGGFDEVISEADGITVEGPVNTGNEPNESFSMVENTMSANSDAVALVSLDCCSLGAAAQWAEQNGSEVPVIGYDALSTTLSRIESGVIDVAISQNPVQQSYEAVRVLRDLLLEGTAAEDVITDSLLITSENVADVEPED